MNNLDFREKISLHIPNFKKFQEILDKDSDILANLEDMFKKIYNIWLLEIIWAKINSEIWLCIMNDKKIDQKKLQEIIDAFKNR